MSSYFTDQRRLLQAAIDLDTADAEVVFAPTVPTQISKIRITIGEATSSAGSVLTYGFRLPTVAAGGDIGTVLGTFTVPAGAAAGTSYVVNVGYVDTDLITDEGGGISQPAETTTGRVVGRLSNQPGLIDAVLGQYFVVQSNGAGTGGAGSISIEYFEIAKDADDAIELTVTRT